MECPACHKELTPDSYFCTWCSKFVPSPEQGTKANLFVRWVAWIIDPLLAITLYFLAIIVFGALFPPLAVLAAVLLPLVYFIWFLTLLRTGRTPGKLLMRLQVVHAQTGQIPGFGKMFLREIIGRVLSGLIFGLGYLWALIDKSGQAFHDKLAGTVVLKLSPGVQPVAAGESKGPKGVGEPRASEPAESRTDGRQTRWFLGGAVTLVLVVGTVLLLRGLGLGPFVKPNGGAALGGQWCWDAGEEGVATWRLDQRGRKLTGSYKWDRWPQRTELQGEISRSGVITLQVTATARPGAEKEQYEGRLQEDGTIVGEQIFKTWRNPWHLERVPGASQIAQVPPSPANPTQGDVSPEQRGDRSRLAPERQAMALGTNLGGSLTRGPEPELPSSASQSPSTTAPANPEADGVSVAPSDGPSRLDPEHQTGLEAEPEALHAELAAAAAQAAQLRQARTARTTELLAGRWEFEGYIAKVRANQAKAKGAFIDIEVTTPGGAVVGALIQPNNPDVPRIDFRGTVDGEAVSMTFYFPREGVTRRWVATLDPNAMRLAGPIRTVSGQGSWSHHWAAVKR